MIYSKIKIRDKRALSEMVGYVLMIVIALGISILVYPWLRNLVGSPNPQEICNEDVALVIDNYNCPTGIHNITLTIRNQGSFNVSGFFIRATDSTNESRIPVIGLNCSNCLYSGRYEFPTPLKPGHTTDIEFIYDHLTKITRLQVQPYVSAKKSKNILLCTTNIVDLRPSGCN